MNIGKDCEVQCTIVDFNEGSKKAKIRITGYQEDKSSSKDVYIWVDYDKLNLED